MPSTVEENRVKWEKISESFSHRWIIFFCECERKAAVSTSSVIYDLQEESTATKMMSLWHMDASGHWVCLYVFPLCVCVCDFKWLCELHILVFLTPGYTQPFDCYIVPAVLHSKGQHCLRWCNKIGWWVKTEQSFIISLPFFPRFPSAPGCPFSPGMPSVPLCPGKPSAPGKPTIAQKNHYHGQSGEYFQKRYGSLNHKGDVQNG